jgi:hypothetical protein
MIGRAVYLSVAPGAFHACVLHQANPKMLPCKHGRRMGQSRAPTCEQRLVVVCAA